MDGRLHNVIPILKKSDNSITFNYSPISLLRSISKLFKRIVFNYLYNFIYSNNLFYKYQSGSLPSNATVFQLIEL